jgi:hypothetical protein
MPVDYKSPARERGFFLFFIFRKRLS